MKYELSKRGIPCIWEKGGRWTNTGEATLIANKKYLPKKPIFVKRGGELACSNHALIPVQTNDTIIKIHYSRGDYEIYLYRIIGFNEEDKIIEKELLNSFTRGEWDVEINDENLENFILNAKKKVRDYHCRTPYHIKRED